MKEKDKPVIILAEGDGVNPEKVESLSRSATLTFISSIASLVLGMTTSIITSRALGPALKGNIDLLNATMSLSITIFGFSLPAGVTYWIAKEEIDLYKLARRLFFVAIIQGCIVWLTLFIIAWTPWQDAFIPSIYHPWGAVIVAVGTFATLLYSYWRAFLAGMQRFITNSILDVINRLLILISAIIALLWANNKGEVAVITVVVASTLAVIVSAIGAYPFALYNVKKVVQPDRLLEIWKTSRPFYFGNLVQFLNYRLDVFLVVYFIGIQTLAHYTVAVSIAQLLWLPALTLQSILFPRLTHMQNEEQRSKETAQIARMTFALTLIMGIALALISVWGITLLYGDKFAPSTPLLLLLLPGIVAFSGANILAAYLTAIGHQSLNLVASLVGVIFTIFINIILLPILGVAGASIASSTSYIATTLLLLYFFCQRTKLPIVSATILNMDDINKLLSLVPSRLLSST